MSLQLSSTINMPSGGRGKNGGTDGLVLTHGRGSGTLTSDTLHDVCFSDATTGQNIQRLEMVLWTFARYIHDSKTCGLKHNRAVPYRATPFQSTHRKRRAPLDQNNISPSGTSVKIVYARHKATLNAFIKSAVQYMRASKPIIDKLLAPSI